MLIVQIDISKQAKILITGASGFVGAHVAKFFSEKGFFVVSGGFKNSLAQEVQRASDAFVSVDLSDKDACRLLLANVKPDVIVHAAALADVAACEKSKEQAFLINTQATRNIAEEVSRYPHMKLIFFSTDLVFDGGIAPEMGFSEFDSVSPLSSYAKSKSEAEQLVLSLSEHSSVLRLSLVYGPLIGEKGGFLKWMMEQGANGKQVSLFVDEWRTPVWIDDVCRSVFALASKSFKTHRVFHAAGASRLSRYEFGLKLFGALGYSSDLLLPVLQSDFPYQAPRPKDVSLSVVHTQKELGFEFLNPDNGISKFIERLLHST